MKSRGLYFSAFSIPLLISGAKTQTRRIVGGQKPVDADNTLFEKTARKGAGWIANDLLVKWEGPANLPCPYGVPGDELWVRESFAAPPGSESRKDVVYRADHPSPKGLKWTTGRFMPRWASRITLELVDRKLERLHDISDEDALREGVKRDDAPFVDMPLPTPLFTFDGQDFADPRTAFSWGWDGVNEKRGNWEANPWVWVLTVKLKEVQP